MFFWKINSADRHAPLRIVKQASCPHNGEQECPGRAACPGWAAQAGIAVTNRQNIFECTKSILTRY
jgi:hypothetical protein